MTTLSDKDQGSATQWYERWEALVRHALSRRLNRAEDVDDLAQEVFLRLLRVKRPDLVRNPQSYLYRIAINVAEEWRHRAPQALDHSSEALASLVSEEDPAAAARRGERDRAIRRSLDALAQAPQTALVLHVHEGLTYEQIAQHMGVTRRAVKRYVANGYAALRDDLQEYRADDKTSRERSNEKQHDER